MWNSVLIEFEKLSRYPFKIRLKSEVLKYDCNGCVKWIDLPLHFWFRFKFDIAQKPIPHDVLFLYYEYTISEMQNNQVKRLKTPLRLFRHSRLIKWYLQVENKVSPDEVILSECDITWRAEGEKSALLFF